MNVLQAAKSRIAYTFNNFSNIYIAFSGGKDSTVMLHLVMNEAIKRGVKVSVLFIDLEAQYKSTIEHIETCVSLYNMNIELYWVCLPLNLRNSVSSCEPFWTCWNENKKPKWVRKKSDLSYAGVLPFYVENMEFEDFVFGFNKWIGSKGDSACFVGIRMQESYIRRRSFFMEKEKFDNKKFTTRITKNTYNFYPIYDWKTTDIWAFHGKHKDLPYNKIYDLMFMAGLSISQSRICHPYGDDQKKGLWLYQVLEPKTWNKIVDRVLGANSGCLYIKETGNINGKNATLPLSHTWKSYYEYLIDMLPSKSKIHFAKKINEYVLSWNNKGYKRGIPDEAPLKLESLKKVPSYKLVCKAILKNDFWCKTLGFNQERSREFTLYLNQKRNTQKELFDK